MSLFTGCVANGALCGPFLISKGFWIDAGRCVLDGDDPDSDEGNLRVHHFDILSNVEIGVEYWMIFGCSQCPTMKLNKKSLPKP